MIISAMKRNHARRNQVADVPEGLTRWFQCIATDPIRRPKEDSIVFYHPDTEVEGCVAF